MLVIKPYGRTRTEGIADNRVRRITLHTSRAVNTDIADFVDATPEYRMAHWISAIDKIARKPAGPKPASREQRALRALLADAAWAEMVAKGVLSETEAAALAPIWEWKIHPYPKGDLHPRTPEPSAKGRWYARFVGDVEPNALKPADAAAIAAKIHRHLHECEARKGGGAKDKRVGRIEAQTASIAGNVHRIPEAAILDAAPAWRDGDWTAYTAAGDVAALIRAAGEPTKKDGKPRLFRGLAGPILYEHYARLFVKDGSILPIAKAQETFPTLFALHSEIKATYAVLLGRKKLDRISILPANAQALRRLIEQRRGNQTLAQMVRLGKVIHYQASAGGELDTPSNVTNNWPSDIANSRYWTSDGQTEIKRNEALVRVWKSSITLAARTLTDWCGSVVTGDVLTGIGERFKACKPFDAPAFDRKSTLLFGNQASEFVALGETDKREALQFALKGWAELRNNSFHFKGRKGFFTGLKKAANLTGTDVPISASAAAILSLWDGDQAGRAARIKAIMVGAHMNYFLVQAQLCALFDAVEISCPRESPLPRLRRVLDRAETSWRRRGYQLTLPAPGKREELEKYPARLCQFTALKLIYERSFPEWLDAQGTAALNRWINRASDRSTAAAQFINKSKLAQARMAGFGTMLAGETFGEFVDRLTAETATHFRVQQSYASNAVGAREQADHLNNLRCDVTALAFEAYLHEAGFGWLLAMSAKQDQPGAPISDVAALPSPAADIAQGEEWQKRLYFLIHLVPVDDVSRLLHQLRKWTVLEKKDHIVSPAALDEISQVEAVFMLYLDMHDAKFEGGDALPVDDAFKAIFEHAGDFDALFRAPGEPVNDRYIPVRGLREILRYGDFKPLEALFTAHNAKVWHQDVERLAALEDDADGASPIAAAQRAREDLHKQWVDGANVATIKADYCAALAKVIHHRHRANHVRLNNHVRLHRLLMQVLARLVDYAGLWERDLYFVSLALVHLKSETVRDCFSDPDALKNGQIINAVRKSTLKDELGRWFADEFLGMSVGTRNDLSHFNMLRSGGLDLTALVNRTRQLMRYDRKLKNAVSLSIIELLEREGLILAWGNRGHDLADASLTIKQATHLGVKAIVENLHSDVYGEMVAALFCGQFDPSADVRGDFPLPRI